MDDQSIPRPPDADLVELIRSWNSVPAFIRDRHLTVVASNALAAALSESMRVGINLAEYTFLDPAIESDVSNWRDLQQEVAALLKDSLEQHEEDAVFRDLVGELSSVSLEFSEDWADEIRRPTMSRTIRFTHPLVGDVTFVYYELQVPDRYDNVLVVLRPADAPSSAALSLLIEATRGEQN